MKYFVFLLLFVVLLPISCKNGENPFDGLPAATQKGANTMGCRINGKVWKPKGDLVTAPVSASFYQGSLNFSGINNNDNMVVLAFEIKNVVTKTGKFVIKGECDFDVYGNTCITTSGEKGVYSVATGEITITALDTTTSPTPEVFVSGTFEFTAKNTADTTDIITVTDGRFDISFQ